MKKLISSVLVLVLCLAMAGNAFAADIGINDISSNVVSSKSCILSESFVAHCDYSVSFDSNGDEVIILSHVAQLTSNQKEVGNEYIKTTAVILPSDSVEANDIIDSIEVLRGGGGAGSHWEDGWFYGSSVYLKSTVNYTEISYGGTILVGMDKFTINTVSVNSGTSISAMTVSMGQIGVGMNGYAVFERKDVNAMTQRVFTDSASWAKVDRYASVVSACGASIICTAMRSGGSSTFVLPNNII